MRSGRSQSARGAFARGTPQAGACRIKSIFLAPWAGASVTSVPARGPRADSANSAASRLIKNHSSNCDARYNEFYRVKRQRALQGCKHAEG